MARIYGTIESLKSLKAELNNNGISRFNSVKEINDFLSNYDTEKLAILDNESEKLEGEYFDTCINLKREKQQKAETINSETEKIDRRIFDLQTKIDSTDSESHNFLKRLLSNITLYSLKKRLNYYVKNKPRLIKSSVKSINRSIENYRLFIKEYETENKA